jgi:hypothetical protein
LTLKLHRCIGQGEVGHDETLSEYNTVVLEIISRFLIKLTLFAVGTVSLMSNVINLPVFVASTN